MAGDQSRVYPTSHSKPAEIGTSKPAIEDEPFSHKRVSKPSILQFAESVFVFYFICALLFSAICSQVGIANEKLFSVALIGLPKKKKKCNPKGYNLDTKKDIIKNFKTTQN